MDVRSIRSSSLAIAAITLLVGCLLLVENIGGPLERAIDPLRFATYKHNASGKVMIVEMDAQSTAAIRRWPWPRRNYAQVVDALRQAGAASIVFDVDFSSASVPQDDHSAIRLPVAPGGERKKGQRASLPITGGPMSKFTTQQRVANYMGAISHLLSGRSHGHQAFIDGVELIVSGSEPHALQLMQFTGRCRETGRPIVWIHLNPEVPQVPQIGLVVAIDGQTRVFENCMLWSASDGSRARLVPDSFTFGAYRFDDGLRLRHIAKAPARTFKAAEPGMVRAYDRLIALEVAQLDRGEVFKLPELARAA